MISNTFITLACADFVYALELAQIPFPFNDIYLVFFGLVATIYRIVVFFLDLITKVFHFFSIIHYSR